jgi:uncharacterized integral membrane protein
LSSNETEHTHPEAPPEPAAPPQERAQQPPRDLRWQIRRVRVYSSTAILVATTVILVGLIAANTRSVTISWVLGDSKARLVWIIAAAALVGWVAGIATSAVVRRRIQRKL